MLQLRHYYSYHLVYYRPSTFYQVESTSEGLIKLAQPFLRTSKSTSSGTHFHGYSQYSTYICRAGGIDPAAPVLARPVFNLVPRPLFSIFICGGGKRLWWISIGRFVLQIPRFWESLIGVDNYKGLFDKVSITIVACSYVIK